VWGEGTLRNGLIAAALIIPVFLYRHYVQDRGVFPNAILEEGYAAREEVVTRRAGMLPYAALIACALLIWAANRFAILPG
jgi:hypothetical protein